jgi:predicted Zn finger-like uncharacterized protein
MSFNVTQCPACESTFNTNSRVLAAAAGKVRCGACLNVFEAIDNFLVADEAGSEQSQDESVFVGNNPEEFFDPSSFLTRSALRESQDNEPVVADFIDQQNRLEELEQAETLSEDFFATVAEELQSKDETPTTEIESAADGQAQTDQDIDKPEESQAGYNEPSSENIDSAFEEAILGSFLDQQSEPAEPLPEETEPAPKQTDETQPDFAERSWGMGLSASLTFNPGGIPQVRIGEPESPSQTDAAADEPANLPNTEILAEAELDRNIGEAPDEPSAANTESVGAVHGEEASEEASKEADKSSVLDEPAESFAANEVAETISEPATPAPEEYIVPADAPSTEANDEGRHDEEIAEQHENAESDRLAESEELKPDTASEEEDSTEAIRARALESELNDEEALEAIPKENLVALGSMSTPVELLARKESRWLRSTLLFLSVLLLGGLLAAQYLWQRMEIYSQLAQLRPLYELTCSYVGCELPDFTDIDSIRSENLTVQTHPNVANGLMVNTIIRNNSAFEQAFPIMILSFNSADNTVIALREFSSDEYLDPALRAVQAMPVRTPVQIELAILDPGPEAVNYTLAFRWP